MPLYSIVTSDCTNNSIRLHCSTYVRTYARMHARKHTHTHIHTHVQRTHTFNGPLSRTTHTRSTALCPGLPTHVQRPFVQDYPHTFNGPLSRTTRVSRYQKSKISLDLNEARDDGVLGCSGISWTMCKQSVPLSRQTTTPTPHTQLFTGQMLFLGPEKQCQSTEGMTISSKVIGYLYTVK